MSEVASIDFVGLTTVLVQRPSRGVLDVRLNRPAVRNAMNLAMLTELEATLAGAASSREVRAVVLRGAGGHFCAGGDLKEMAAARAAGADSLVTMNRALGRVLERIETMPQVTVAVCEGTVLGGGLGLACATDITLVEAQAELGLPEVTLGLPPAQIAPFLVKRMGLSQSRHLALTGARFDGTRAAALGIAHACYGSKEALEDGLGGTLRAISRCAPGAVAATKEILRSVGTLPLSDLLDRGAELFAAAVRGPEGAEGAAAFLGKRRPAWDDGEGGAGQ